MKKSVVQTAGKQNVEKEKMKKSVTQSATEKPPDDAIAMNKANIPIAPSSRQHIGGWRGLNKRVVFDSGSLSEAVNVSFCDYPNVESVTMCEKVTDFEIIEKAIKKDGTIESKTSNLGEVYDARARRDEMFVAAENGFVYAKMIEDKFCYIPICTDREGKVPQDIDKMLHGKGAKCTFAETVDDENVGLSINRNVCVFSAWTKKNSSGKKAFLPVFPSGSIEFVDSFLSLAAKSECDTSRIYVKCDEKGKADEVWRYLTKVRKTNTVSSPSTVNCWCELRRNLYLTRQDSVLTIGYYPDDTANAKINYNTSVDVVGETIAKIEETETFYYIRSGQGYTKESYGTYTNEEEFLYSLNLDDLIRYSGVNQTRDNISGLIHFYYGDGIVTPGEDTDYTIKPGIFNYEETDAPIFSNVTFYKGRVFGSVGGTIIASCYNEYNKWQTDTTEDISSAHAWIATTTSNSNADGDIVAMREYMGRISVFKSGFMQEVYGGSNPFSVQDVYAVGTPFSEAVCESYGRLCFASRHAIRTYSGSFPKIIGDELNVDEYENVKMLGDDRYMVVATKEEMYKYDFATGFWEERKSEFAADDMKLLKIKDKMYMLSKGSLIDLNGAKYGKWSFATDYMTENTLSLKRLQKIRLLCILGSESKCDVFIEGKNEKSIKLFEIENSSGEEKVYSKEVSVTNVSDRFMKLRFSGEGYFKLIGLDMELKNGSEATYE